MAGDVEGRLFPVVLSFDVDGEAGVLARNPRNADNPVELSFGRYGVTLGVPRILELLERHEIRATFFVPGWIAVHYPETVRRIAAAGHEIGHHGFLHEVLENVDAAEEEQILLRGLDALDKAAGVRPVGYRAPRYFLTNNSIELLARHGFHYSSNMMDADAPYPYGRAGGMVELPVERTLGDAAQYLYTAQIPNAKMMTNSQVLELWCGAFDGLAAVDAYCMMTCHPEITGRPYRMAALEEWINHVKGRPGARFMTGEQVAGQVRQAG